jgi:hypothetical protein
MDFLFIIYFSIKPCESFYFLSFQRIGSSSLFSFFSAAIRRDISMNDVENTDHGGFPIRTTEDPRSNNRSNNGGMRTGVTVNSGEVLDGGNASTETKSGMEDPDGGNAST